MEKWCLDHGLSSEAAKLLMQHAERMEFARKEIVIEEGQRDDYTWFVVRGSVRGYVMREQKCAIIFFAFEGDVASLCLGARNSAVASYTIETMEASTLLRIARQQIEELFSSSTELANWGRRMAEKALCLHEEYFTDYSWRGKGAQYLRLLHHDPTLLQRVPLKDLAAYLMVTPQTLSRIRAELCRKLP